MVQWNIGCSGFYYNHWKGIFYPDDLPKSKWFDFYKERFHTLELNVTFYRFPQLTVFENWYDKTPSDFSFAVKAPRLITHFKQFNETADMMQGYYSVIAEGLKDKLGAVLFQLPPRTKYTPERLEKILATIDSDYPNVIEFRHDSWWNAEVYNELSKHKISFCGMSHPSLPDEVIQNSPLVYYRFHGVPELYKSPYDSNFLRKVADQIRGNKRAKKAFLYFNNDIGGSAIVNAGELQDYVGNQKTKQAPKKKGTKKVRSL
jgi:uncharacterized protein YecE (DUF72 family)